MTDFLHELTDLQSDMPDQIARNLVRCITDASKTEDRAFFVSCLRDALASAELLIDELPDLIKRGKQRVAP